MNPTTLTQRTTDQLFQFMGNCDQEDVQQALQYWNDSKNFRTFGKGLTSFLQACGYDKDITDAEQKTTFLYTRLQDIGVSITKQTIKSWFLDKHQPFFSVAQRKKMFEICFALSASLPDVIDFFQKVYGSRAFNCHMIEEAVYYYCFFHQKSYQEATYFLNEIAKYPVQKNISIIPEYNFTKKIQQNIEQFQNDEEFLQFFAKQKSMFAIWNCSAISTIETLLSEIQGKEEDRIILEKYLNGSVSDISSCGLVIQEIIKKYEKRIDIEHIIKGKDITSRDFTLIQILGSEIGIQNGNVYDIVRRNFPSKKMFSEILHMEKRHTSTSYDAIRKALILLKFYHFWVNDILVPEIQTYYKDNCPFDTYMEETNALLCDCGYEPLYIGNLYDWIFLYASIQDKPLQALRMFLSNIMDEMDEE